ncbi:MAG TPA: ABC transporter permease subunit [Candidatus Eisenbergiella merdavium]|uniref:ABC transporter permease subunit n=1 Tax=Candidatus Eisenbergiella merdavium TaxID=2838551 RepID=A0A9D2NHD5_9FIRM|nr:ABC transporter permease subunit [Candidatus Eisenbergiella merdavium]
MKRRNSDLQSAGRAGSGKGRGMKTRNSTLSYLRRHWLLYAMLALPVLYYFLFCYRAMPGVVIAFKNYNMFKGIWDSPWVGLEFFERVSQSKTFWQSVRNTMVLNILGLVLGFPLPIVLALFLNEISHALFKKTVQTVLYLPHFISWSVVGGMMYQFFASSGLINTVVKAFGGQPVPFLTNKGWWIFTYFIVGVWKSIGWNTIIYLSAMTGIDQEIYEAARVDGCSRFRMMTSITLPCIKDTVAIMLILAVGGMASIGFEQPYVMQNSTVMEVADVISTFVYRVGLEQGDFSIGTAVGLAQSVINFVLVISANAISKRVSGNGIW